MPGLKTKTRNRKSDCEDVVTNRHNLPAPKSKTPGIRMNTSVGTPDPKLIKNIVLPIIIHKLDINTEND